MSHSDRTCVSLTPELLLPQSSPMLGPAHARVSSYSMNIPATSKVKVLARHFDFTGFGFASVF
jgi:hypothetical protein